jgi:Fe-S-cluster containining protein
MTCALHSADHDPELPVVAQPSEQQDLPAGQFSSWLRHTQSVLKTRSGAEVPCGECNACCRSSYFIHIDPDETETIARIPSQLLFPAPGYPDGGLVMGHDQRGHCPMLVDDACSIYEHRPVVCRNYDCRVFATAGIAAGDEDKELVSRRARRWRFGYSAERDRLLHSAVQAAVRFLPEHSAGLGERAPSTSTQLAVLAIKVCDVFLEIHDEHHKAGSTPTAVDIVDAVIEANDTYDD